MAIKYNQCPRCSSLNVIKIFYGLPTPNVLLMVEEGKRMLGGGYIRDSDPEYYCKDCETKWNRQTAIDKAYDGIIGVTAYVGGYFDGYYEVEIDFESRKLRWSPSFASDEEYYEKIIRQKTLDNFIAELKRMNVLDWKSRYIEPDVCDGTQWGLEIRRNGRNIQKSGSNKFPDEWHDFCRLIKKVSGKDFS